MKTDPFASERTSAENSPTAMDVELVLRARGWLDAHVHDGTDAEVRGWCERAAFLLGPPHVGGRESLAELLALVFNYDAAELVRRPENQSVLVREGAREVIRELANRILAGPDVDSDRFKEIIEGLKANLRFRGRELFYPIRLALAGRTGEGELDRVILLLDSGAKMEFATLVKGTRARIIEFCAAFD